jgi:tetratricopeptide (TPR) repeat protein
MPTRTGPLYVSGRVAPDDGSTPEQGAAIQVSCLNQIRLEGYATPKGKFHLPFGSYAAGVPDASVNSLGRPDAAILGAVPVDAMLAGCELIVTLPGYRAAPVQLGTLREPGDLDVGVLVLHRVGPADGLVVSATTLRAPKSAQNALQKGRDAARGKQWLKAALEFRKAVDAYPEFSLAWCELGKAQEAARQTELAEASFAQATKADPRFLDPYLALAGLYLDQKRWPELARVTEDAVRLDPYDYPFAYLLNSYANYNTGHLDAAETSALKAAELDTSQKYPQIGRLLAEVRERRQSGQSASGQ